MTESQIRKTIAIYRRKFKEMDIAKKRFTKDGFPALNKEYLAHCHWMLDRMEEFLTEGRPDKAFRWLGFVQGCLWKTFIFTLPEMKNHNRKKSHS